MTLRPPGQKTKLLTLVANHHTTVFCVANVMKDTSLSVLNAGRCSRVKVYLFVNVDFIDQFQAMQMIGIVGSFEQI